MRDRLTEGENKKDYAEVESTDAIPPFFKRVINNTG